MKILVSGSFDPITLGHIDIIARAKNISNDIVVGVFNNENKSYMFDLATRVNLAKLALPDIKVIGSSGYVVDFCKKHNIDLIVRGFRNYIDYEYENMMAVYNYLNGGVHTYLLPTTDKYYNVSSTLVRECIQNGEKLDAFLPQVLIDRLRRN